MISKHFPQFHILLQYHQTCLRIDCYACFAQMCNKNKNIHEQPPFFATYYHFIWPGRAKCQPWSKMSVKHGWHKENTQRFKTPCQCLFCCRVYIHFFYDNTMIKRNCTQKLDVGLAISQNQYSWHQTHSVWLGHILCTCSMDHDHR